MKRHKSQVAVAIVCSLLGFLLAYQYKELALNKKAQSGNYSNSDILDEVESLKKEKKQLQETNDELNKKLTDLEQQAVSGNVEQEIKKQLDNSRLQLGLVDAQGPGIKIKLSLKTNLFNSNIADSTSTLSDADLVSIVNTLWFSKAEAISINGYRITQQTGIKVSGNYIWIGSAGRIIPTEDIVIEAIGDIKSMKAGLDVQTFTYGNYNYYDVKIDEYDNLVLKKTTQALRNDYVTAVTGEN